MNVHEPIQRGVSVGKGGKPSRAPRRATGPSLKDLISLERPVTVEELCAALPFLSVRTAQRALRSGEIPGVKITERKWVVSRAWLIRLSEQQDKGAKSKTP